jgi:hypothetical protein
MWGKLPIGPASGWGGGTCRSQVGDAFGTGFGAANGHHVLIRDTHADRYAISFRDPHTDALGDLFARIDVHGHADAYAHTIQIDDVHAYAALVPTSGLGVDL